MAYDPAHDVIATENRQYKVDMIAWHCYENGPDPSTITGRGAHLAVERAAGLVRSSRSSVETWQLVVAEFDRLRARHGDPPWLVEAREARHVQ